MGVKKQIVLIPYWVQEILVRNQKTLATCLELDQCKPLMALNDLVCFSALQCCSQQLLGYNVGNELSGLWRDSIPEGYPETRQFSDLVETLNSDASFKAEVQERLFTIDSKVDRYNKPFVVYDLTPEVCGVVLYPGFFTIESKGMHQLSLVEALLKILYVYDAYHEVAKTPLYRRYLELLSSVSM